LKKKISEPEVIEPRLSKITRLLAEGEIPGDEQFDSQASIEDVLNSDTKGRIRCGGIRAIAATYDLPAFGADGKANVVERIVQEETPRNMAEAIKNNPLLKRHDCTHGCGGHETVQPINSTGMDWECSQCGRQYKMRKQ
jgi:hypothetical protein